MALLCNQVPLGIVSTAGCSSSASQLASVKVVAIFVLYTGKKKRHSVLFSSVQQFQRSCNLTD